MIKRLACLAIASLLLATGCVPLAFSPLYRDEQDFVSVEGLEGQWMLTGHNDDLPRDWNFTREEGWPGYVVTTSAAATQEKPATQARFRAAVVEIDGRRFLDLQPREHQPELNFWFALHVPLTHSIWRIELTDQELRLAALNQSAVNQLLREKPDATPHRIVDESQDGLMNDNNQRVILLGETDELRRFVVTLDDDTYFKDGPEQVDLKFERAPAEAPAPPTEHSTP